MGKNSFVFHTEWMDLFREAELTADEIVAVMDGIEGYVMDGCDPVFTDRTIKSVWATIKRLLDLDMQRYAEKSEKGRKAAMMRWHKENADACGCIQNDADAFLALPNDANDADTDTDTDTDTEYDTDTDYNSTSNTFSMTDSYIYNNNIYNNNPTKQSVLSYFTSQSQSAKEAEKFYDYYTAKDWKIDGKPIISWHNVANRWISNIRSPAKTKAHNFTQRSYTKEQDNRLNKILFGH